jgi:hypothetical protein
VLAFRLYGCGLAFACLVVVVAAFPRGGGESGQYLAIAAFVGFVATWGIAMLRSFRFGWRSPYRWRYIAVWNIAVFTLELVILGSSLAVSRGTS